MKPDVAVGVGRVTGEAARVPDGALAAELIEQPLGAELRVLDLVVVQVPGVRVGDVGVDRDGLDALPPAASASAGLRAVGIVRVEDDGVDALGDQVTDVGQLAGRIGVAVDHGEVGDLAGRRAPAPSRCRPAPRGSRCRRRHRSSSRWCTPCRRAARGGRRRSRRHAAAAQRRPCGAGRGRSRRGWTAADACGHDDRDRVRWRRADIGLAPTGCPPPWSRDSIDPRRSIGASPTCCVGCRHHHLLAGRSHGRGAAHALDRLHRTAPATARRLRPSLG